MRFTIQIDRSLAKARMHVHARDTCRSNDVYLPDVSSTGTLPNVSKRYDTATKSSERRNIDLEVLRSFVLAQSQEVIRIYFFY